MTPVVAAEPMIEFRCPTDGRLLFKVSDVADLEVEAKCPRCKSTVKARLVEQAATTSER